VRRIGSSDCFLTECRVALEVATVQRRLKHYLLPAFLAISMISCAANAPSSLPNISTTSQLGNSKSSTYKPHYCSDGTHRPVAQLTENDSPCDDGGDDSADLGSTDNNDDPCEGCTGGGGPPKTISTAKGTATLTNCSSAANATKQATAAAYSEASNSGGNEYGSATYVDASGNYYNVTPFTSGSETSVDFTGLQPTVNGLTLVSVTHIHWGYLDGSTFVPYTVENWQANSIDDTTDNHFSPADESVSEDYGVPIDVELGTVEQTFQWGPAPQSNGTWNEQTPDTSLGVTSPSYSC
jgi:hypothetical protein